MDFKEWSNLGVAVATLVALGTAVWRVCVWISRRVDKLLDEFIPKFNAILVGHIDLVQTLKEEYPKQTQQLAAQTLQLAHQTEILNRLAKVDDEIMRLQASQHKEAMTLWRRIEDKTKLGEK